MSENMIFTTMDNSSLWLALVSLLLLAGWIAGELAARLRLPRLTGYMLAGGVFGLLDRVYPAIDLQQPARLLGEMGLGVLLFDLGRRVDFSWLKRDPTLALTAVAEMAASFIACFGILYVLNIPVPWAAVGAAIALATSPGVVIAIVRDARAQGQVTERLLWLTAANTAVAAILSMLLVGWFQAEKMTTWWHALVFYPAYLVAGSLLLAAMVATMVSLLARWMRKDAEHLVMSFAAILLTLAVARGLELSVPLSLLALGLITHHQHRRADRSGEEFGNTAQPLIVLFFVFAGTSLASADWLAYGWAAVGLAAARTLAKWLAAGLAARASGLAFRHSFRLGLALMPMSGLSLMLAVDIGRLYPAFDKPLAGILLPAIALCGLLGPLATHFALVQSGEAAPVSEIKGKP